MRIAIVTDSTAYIPLQEREQLSIHMIPLNVTFGDASYQEEVDMMPDQFYARVREEAEFPKTSQPAVGLFIELFERLAKEYDAIISIHLSSGISGTYQTATTVGDMIESAKVYTFDSEISCYVQGFYAIEASKMAKNGKSPEEIIARLEEMKESVEAYFIADDLNHLHRGGRLNGAAAFVGSLLQVKPILYFQDKVIIPFEKIRTRKKARKRIMDVFHERASQGLPMKAVVIHANCEEEAKEWQQEIQQLYPNVEVSLSYFGAVIGTHLGEGAIGFGWYKK
ncbi:DegV family protein [Ectobacillus sp. sgz5001026]|uniref:DegV family protein n=1 Tax=Ectobacillus sp. sgz5001026 TaxID=3242473 RepID=UPI0036D3166B